jgi:hypothetical protein
MNHKPVHQSLPEIEEGDEQRRDAMLVKLLKTPPKQRPKRERKQAGKAATPNPKRK